VDAPPDLPVRLLPGAPGCHQAWAWGGAGPPWQFALACALGRRRGGLLNEAGWPCSVTATGWATCRARPCPVPPRLGLGSCLLSKLMHSATVPNLHLRTSEARPGKPSPLPCLCILRRAAAQRWRCIGTSLGHARWAGALRGAPCCLRGLCSHMLSAPELQQQQQQQQQQQPAAAGSGPVAVRDLPEAHAARFKRDDASQRGCCCCRIVPAKMPVCAAVAPIPQSTTSVHRAACPGQHDLLCRTVSASALPWRLSLKAPPQSTALPAPAGVSQSGGPCLRKKCGRRSVGLQVRKEGRSSEPRAALFW